MLRSPNVSAYRDVARELERPVDTVNACRWCGATEALTWFEGATVTSLTKRFCAGPRYGFLWLRKCKREPHLHIRCRKCGGRWIVVPRVES